MVQFPHLTCRVHEIDTPGITFFMTLPGPLGPPPPPPPRPWNHLPTGTMSMLDATCLTRSATRSTPALRAHPTIAR